VMPYFQQIQPDNFATMEIWIPKAILSSPKTQSPGVCFKLLQYIYICGRVCKICDSRRLTEGEGNHVILVWWKRLFRLWKFFPMDWRTESVQNGFHPGVEDFKLPIVSIRYTNYCLISSAVCCYSNI
jgi:hypothetical protein